MLFWKIRASKRNVVHIEGLNYRKYLWIGHTYQNDILAIMVANGGSSVAWALSELNYIINIINIAMHIWIAF